jgi:hypothetical protein
MAKQTKALLGVEEISALADKGYHTGEQLQQCVENKITTFVSPKEPSTKDIGLYPISMFSYNKEQDIYTCPKGSILKTKGTWYTLFDFKTYWTFSDINLRCSFYFSNYLNSNVHVML